MTTPAMSATGELRQMQGASVMVIGDVILDRYVVGAVTRISPEAPVPVLHQQSSSSSLGGAANVAANVAALGATVTLIGRVGTDDEGSELARLLDAASLPNILLIDPEAPTVCKTRLVAGDHQLARIDREDVTALDAAQAATVLEHVERFVSVGGPRSIVLADYSKGMLGTELIHEIINRADAAGVPVASDPKGRDLSRYAGSALIQPNLAEARHALGYDSDIATVTDALLCKLAEGCLEASRAKSVVLTCSSYGAVVAGGGLASPVRRPTAAREVSDVSGAGDTFIAVMAMGVATGMDLLRSVDLANLAAGIVCSKAGTAVVHPSELLVASGGPEVTPAARKVLRDLDEAAAVGRQFRADGKRLVFTNGCFDILHAGHVHLLQAARGAGDALMVALNADRSVARLKGAGRPVQHEEDRAQIIASMECVDFVVLFAEDTPLELIDAVRPAVIVKGDDYSLDEVVGATEVKAWGGSVMLVPRIEGRSTTATIRSLQS
jgi:D-beta-D-heptose 7-phosphate kinase/D-beta-D-heptose 1-phosphate adenosyltransferase